MTKIELLQPLTDEEIAKWRGQTMLTAEEARAQMPDKDKIVHDNVQSICNEISRASQRGMDYYCTPLIVCVKETMDKLRQLGYTVSSNGIVLTVSWRCNE